MQKHEIRQQKNMSVGILSSQWRGRCQARRPGTSESVEALDVRVRRRVDIAVVNRLVQWLAGQSRQLEERPMGCAEEWRAANRRWQVRAGQKDAAWRGVTQNGSEDSSGLGDSRAAE